MDRRMHMQDPTKYLSIIIQYFRNHEYHGMQLHLSPADNRSAYLTYRYHVKQAMDISNAPKTVSAFSYAACLLLKGTHEGSFEINMPGEKKRKKLNHW